MKYRLLTPLVLLAGLFGFGWLAGCDAGLDGARFENQPPRTFLAVRDTSLAERLCTPTPAGPVCNDDDNLFTSTVFVSWSGVDPDGFVIGYDIRWYDVSENPGSEDLWRFTTRRDTIVLFPIPVGQTTAQVVFEARAIDNEGLKDPTPARTVFPIINSPPAIALRNAELPPDSTWTVFSFGFEATDPDGPEDISAIEVSLNDPENFVSLPPGVTFATFIAEDAPPGAPETSARVFLGRGFASTEITVPGLRLDANNTFYIRSVDRSGARSNTLLYPNPDLEQTWFVKQPKSQVLLVNDFRSTRFDEAMPFHEATLGGYLAEGTTYDVWNLWSPPTNSQYSEALPPVANPTLRETLKQWRYIYWVANNVTAVVSGSNLALAANFLEDFLADGGRLFVQVPFTAPPGGELVFDNPAYDVLPAESIVTRPGTTVPPNLAVQSGARILPVEAVPGTGRVLPELRAERLAFMLPYTMNFTATVPLYQGQFVDRDDNNAAWTGPSFTASMDRDRRVGLLALQVYTRNRFEFVGADGDPQAPCLAIQYILEGLTFPGTPGTCPTP